jgi:excisionase family DNA binding protein
MAPAQSVLGSHVRESALERRRLASIQKAAEYADVNPRTIRRRIADGTINGYRLGRAIRVDLNELDAALCPIPTAGGGVA